MTDEIKKKLMARFPLEHEGVLLAVDGGFEIDVDPEHTVEIRRVIAELRAEETKR